MKHLSTFFESFMITTPLRGDFNDSQAFEALVALAKRAQAEQWAQGMESCNYYGLPSEAEPSVDDLWEFPKIRGYLRVPFKGYYRVLQGFL